MVKSSVMPIVRNMETIEDLVEDGYLYLDLVFVGLK
jgi:hypothetical protein